MSRWMLLTNLIMILVVVIPGYAAAPMVDKQIFGAAQTDSKPPEPPKSTKNETREMADQKIKNEILFTGVIITPGRKVALLKEKKETARGLAKKEGDTIHGMVLKSIASNHVIITDPEGKDIRYNLFQSDRKRPDAPPPPPAAAAAPGQPGAPQDPAQFGKPQAGGAASALPAGGQSLPGPAEKTGNPAQGTDQPAVSGQQTQTPKANPFGEIFKKFKDDRVKGVVPNSNFRNPFQDAMNKAIGQ